VSRLDPQGLESWSDERLGAAFRTAFDRSAPGYLRERITADISLRVPAPSASRGFRDLVRTATAAGALVVTIVVAASLTSQGPPTHPLGSALVTPGGTAHSVPIEAGVPFPATVRTTGPARSYAVLSVAAAVAIRDGGADPREIAVAGWYSAPQPLPCPLLPDEYQRLESCTLNTSWLLTVPTPLDPDANTAGPSIHPVVDWTPSTSWGAPMAVVFVGHFDDLQAIQCPAGERRQRCQDRFVVDRVAWDEAGLDFDFPTDVAGLPIVTVSEALAVRETNRAQELAVAGWYQTSGPMFCPFTPAAPVPFLEGDCTIPSQWLMEAPESLYHVTRTSGSTTITGTGPVGPAFNAVFPTVAEPGAPSLPADGGSTPGRALLIGHFNDARAALCTRDTPEACRLRFVVDAVAWSGGAARALPEWQDLRYPAGPTPTEDPVHLVRIQAPIPVGAMLSVAAVDGLRLNALWPGLRLPSSGTYWIVTAVDARGPDRFAATFIVTTDGRAQWLANFPADQRTPEPSP
jgi:hypothetical protein